MYRIILGTYQCTADVSGQVILQELAELVQEDKPRRQTLSNRKQGRCTIFCGFLMSSS